MRKIGWVLGVFLLAGCHKDHPSPSANPMVPNWRSVQGNIESDRQVVMEATENNVVSLTVCYSLPDKINCVYPVPPITEEKSETQIVLVGAKSAGAVMYEATLQ